MAHMKTAPKVLLGVVAIGLFLLIVHVGQEKGCIPTPGIMKSLNVSKANLPDVRDTGASENVTASPFPTTSVVSSDQAALRAEIWAWNSQMGWIYANGGPQTTKGSLMNKHGVKLTMVRQDDTNQMQNDLIACANELKGGANYCSSGVEFVAVMGDGTAQFFAAINPQLKKLGADYTAEVIGSAGYSRGEDAFMVPPAVKQNPQAAKGLLVAGVVRDGDWNIAEKWAADNNIKNNPADGEAGTKATYDPDAINWVNAPDYIKAAEMYNSGTCEDRQVVHEGKTTGEVKNVCVNAVVTWTPGDVNVAHGKGGLVKVVSTKQYRSQMPNAIIGIKKFNRDHAQEVVGMLAAIFEAGDQIKAFPQVLTKAADLSAKLYDDKDPAARKGAYWETYYKGTKERDRQGLEVELGGSAVNNLADNLVLFGLMPGTNNNFKSTYTVFGNIVVQQYPKLVPSYPDYKDVVNTSYILQAQGLINQSDSGQAETENYSDTGNVVSKKSWHINFKTGSAELTPDGFATVKQMKDDLAITGLSIHVDGYTDNTGSAEVNRNLSQARAEAVVNALRRLAPANFPENRFSVSGHGPDNPVCPANNTAECKAQNRRVDITLVE